MGNKYYDKKGIPHNSSAARDIANTEYLRQEDEFQREQARVTKELLTVQKIQAQINSDRHIQQIDHNDKIQAIALNEAEKAESHRQFEKDIHWLERSDAKGRFEYLIDRNKPKVHKELANRAINKTKLDDLFKNSANTSRLMSCMVEYIEATQKFQDCQSKLAKVNDEIEIIQKKVQPVDLYFAFSMFFSFFAILNIVFAVGEILYFGISFSMFLLSAFMAVFLWKTSVSISKELNPLKDKLIIDQKEINVKIEAVANHVQQCSRVIRELSNEWKKDVTKTVDDIVRNRCRSIDFLSDIKSVVSAIERQFPSSLRVNWTEVSSEDVLKHISATENEIVSFAINGQVGPQILFAQFKKIDAFKASEIEARYASMQHVTGVIYPSNLKIETEEMEDEY